MDTLTEHFDQFFKENCSNNEITIEDLSKICLEHIRNPEIKKTFKKAASKRNDNPIMDNSKSSKRRKFCYWFLIPSILAILCYCAYEHENVVRSLDELVQNSPCILEQNEISMEMSRPLFNCEICKGITTVPVEQNLTRERFEDLYGYTSLPVLVKGTSKEWSARSTFTFDFIKDLYLANEGALEMVENECQFFPYDSSFRTLGQVFNMTQQMADLKLQKWYVGWSNCVPVVEQELRKYYQKPSFLPDDSASTHLDWIFMGGWGYGAPLHIDNVERPSWQAQLSGRKTWLLVPSVECESVCHTLQITVETGDIIVLNTNQWYHSTYIHPGEISITIGSEYD